MERDYLDSGEWIERDGSQVTVGLTKEAVKEIGSITHIQLPTVGERVVEDDAVILIESSKAAIDILSPVTGEIIQCNEKIKKDLSLIEKDPEGEGWLFRITLLI